MIKDYIIKQTLGKGTYGLVYKVQKINSNSVYVIKQIPLSGLSEKERNEVEQEAKILHSINSNYVVKYYDSFKENDNLNIVMEYCDGGDLNGFLIEKKKFGKPLDESLIWKIFIKITIGLADIHRLKILHRDLKTLNIFLKQNLDIKIGDLGVAKVLSKNNFAKTVIGTPYYLSPEICEEKPYNDKSDVWALGCILYELCTFKHPFEARSQGALILKILNNKPEPIDSTFSKELNNIIFKLLDKNYDKRPSCIEILENNIVINKVKSLGLSELLTDLDNITNNQSSNKLNNPINIPKKCYNKNNINNEKENKNNAKPIIKNIKKKQLSAINLLDQINNNKLNFNNLNQYMMQNKKNNLSKINIIKIGDSNNKKSFNNNINKPNKNCSVEYNNFFINDSNIKKINNKKDIITKQYNNIYKQERSDIINKKIGKIMPVKIIFKKSNETPKINNFIESKKEIITSDNSKKKNEDIKTDNNDSKYIQKIKISNSNKFISNNKLKEKEKKKENKSNSKIPIKIKQIIDKSTKFNSQKYEEEVSKNKTEANIRSNSIKNNINSDNKKENSLLLNKNIKITKINSNKDKSNKHSLISFLPKNNLDFNFGEKKKYSTPSNNDNKIFNEKISSNFQIINNDNFQRNDKDKNQQILITNECVDSDEEITGKMKRSESCFNPRINKEKNIIDSDNDNNSYDDDEEENVKEIKENHFQNKLKNTNGKQIENKINILNNEIQNLKEKVHNSKDEMLQLIGDNDYKFIMNLYNIGIKEQNKTDDIYQKIEDFVNKNYSTEKKDKFNDCYLLLISLDCQLTKKIEEINNINQFA